MSGKSGFDISGKSIVDNGLIRSNVSVGRVKRPDTQDVRWNPKEYEVREINLTDGHISLVRIKGDSDE